MTTPRSGDLLQVTRAASVQFIKPIMFRVIRVLDWPTYDGWIWLDGYQLDARSDAVARRSIFVQPAGLVIPRRTAPAPTGRPTPTRDPRGRCRSVGTSPQVGR
ncbi:MULTISPECIES: hypothetical protein [unclassified Micromonospora]|uniref:hypothetical protein n=1 Tax=unclassified Micromonospora TaxID=2617518 RepID=UPI0027E22FC1|nr:hypothetical protein [Micromonospora sp. RL09-050-HVF-A]